jgi:hypothetical protein
MHDRDAPVLRRRVRALRRRGIPKTGLPFVSPAHTRSGTRSALQIVLIRPVILRREFQGKRWIRGCILGKYDRCSGNQRQNSYNRALCGAGLTLRSGRGGSPDRCRFTDGEIIRSDGGVSGKQGFPSVQLSPAHLSGHILL